MSVSAHAATLMGGGPRFEGRPIQLGGNEYVVAPLSVGAVRRLTPVLDRLAQKTPEGGAAAATGDYIDGALQVVHASLVRNYPELTIDDLAELLEVPRMLELLQTVLEVSGFVKAEGGAGNGGAGPR